ncbi:MAG: flagellar export chaperone FliS [Pseudobdellovibrionaceae bacterium]
MAYNPYQKASQAYQKNNDEGLTQMQIVVELYKGMIKNIKLARQMWEERKLDVMTNHIAKTFDILEALQSNLDMENGGEDAVFLNRFYTVIFSSLTIATSKPNPTEYFDQIISYVQQVHDRWYALAYPEKMEHLAKEQERAETTLR